MPSNLNEDDGYTSSAPARSSPFGSSRRHAAATSESFVDETIGESSYPLVSGPMTREAAIKFVDDRERDAFQRFETLRSGMAGGNRSVR